MAASGNGSRSAIPNFSTPAQWLYSGPRGTYPDDPLAVKNMTGLAAPWCAPPRAVVFSCTHGHTPIAHFFMAVGISRSCS